MDGANKDRDKLVIEVAREFDAIEPYADSWDRLAFEAPQRIPMLSHAWIKTYFEFFIEPGESWCCLLARREKELLGVLPVIISPLKNAYFDSSVLRAPFNLHTASVDFLYDASKAEQIILSLVEGLDLVSKNHMGLELLRIPASSPTVSVLKDRDCGSIIIKEFNGKGSFLNTSGSYEEYKSGLGRNFRRNLTKAGNKISQLPNLKTVFLSGSGADAKEVETFMTVEAAGWKSRAGTAIKSSPKLRAFYATVSRRLYDLGWLEWHFLLTDDRPIAAHFATKMGKTLIISKIGYDEEFSRYSPGNILFERTIQRAFESSDTEEINCLTDMAWHDNWKMTKKDYFDFWIYPRRPIPLIYGVLPKIIRQWGRRVPAAKSLYKRIRSLMMGAKH